MADPMLMDHFGSLLCVCVCEGGREEEWLRESHLSQLENKKKKNKKKLLHKLIHRESELNVSSHREWKLDHSQLSLSAQVYGRRWRGDIRRRRFWWSSPEVRRSKNFFPHLMLPMSHWHFNCKVYLIYFLETTFTIIHVSCRPDTGSHYRSTAIYIIPLKFNRTLDTAIFSFV